MSRPITSTSKYAKILLMAFCVAYFVQRAPAKIISSCELVMELIIQGFPEHQLNEWLCLIEAESSRQTEAVGGPDEGGSFDYGLFQINDRYWCSSGDTPGKGCNIQCTDLLTDDITVASVCAKKIYAKQGFDAWLGWKKECKGKDLPEIDC